MTAVLSVLVEAVQRRLLAHHLALLLVSRVREQVCCADLGDSAEHTRRRVSAFSMHRIARRGQRLLRKRRRARASRRL